jgi:hypothetical protein
MRPSTPAMFHRLLSEFRGQYTELQTLPSQAEDRRFRCDREHGTLKKVIVDLKYSKFHAKELL